MVTQGDGVICAGFFYFGEKGCFDNFLIRVGKFQQNPVILLYIDGWNESFMSLSYKQVSDGQEAKRTNILMKWRKIKIAVKSVMSLSDIFFKWPDPMNLF